MNYQIKILEDKIKESLKDLGFITDTVTINPSNRPELGDYQYNGIMPLAKKYQKNPVEIANTLVNILKDYFYRRLIHFDTFHRSQEIL